MYMVYWSEADGAGLSPHAQSFPSDAMREALRFTEALRQRQHAGEPVSFDNHIAGRGLALRSGEVRVKVGRAL